MKRLPDLELEEFHLIDDCLAAEMARLSRAGTSWDRFRVKQLERLQVKLIKEAKDVSTK